MSDFNTLFLSPQWLKEYHTKYPHGLSVMENLIEWVNQINELIGYVNAGPDYVKEVLELMEGDGRLADLINIDLLNDRALSVKGMTTAQIQAVINTFHTRNVIYFPKTSTNIYEITDTLLIPSNTKIVIEKDVVLKLAAGVNKPILRNADLAGNTNISIIGGIFDLDVANQTQQFPCIRFDNLNNSYFEKVIVMGSKGLVSENIGAWHLQDCDNNKFHNCELYNAGAEGLYIIGNDNHILGGVYADCPNGSVIQTEGSTIIESVIARNSSGSAIGIHGKGPKIIGCQVIGGGFPTTNGINLGHPDKPCWNAQVIGNTITDWTGARGIGINAMSHDVVVSNNIIIGMTKTDSIAIAVGDNSYNVTVKGNRIKNCWHGISAALKGNIIEGNTVENGGGTGILIYPMKSGIISNNIVSNNRLYGIYLSVGAERNIVSGNQCYDDQTVKTQKRGIYADGTLNLVSANICTGNTENQIVLQAGNTDVNNIIT